MSEDETKITSPETRVKDPKRVAAGKRLGAISKAAKEKKARERYDRERELIEAPDIISIAACGGAVIVLIGICYGWYTGRTEPTQPEPVRAPSPEPVRERRALDSFD